MSGTNQRANPLSIASQIFAAALCFQRLKAEEAEAEARRAANNFARRGQYKNRDSDGDKTHTSIVYEVLPSGRSNGLNVSEVAKLIDQNTVEGRKRVSGALQTLIYQKKVGASGDKRSKVYWRY